MPKELYDVNDFTDPESALELVDNATRKSLEYDTLAGPEFFATVITTPIPISAADAAAMLGTGTTGTTNTKRMTKFSFMGRIAALHGMFVDEPCELAGSEDEQAKRKKEQIDSQHTEFIGTSADGTMPSKGDIVEVRLQPGSIGKWDLQYGIYTGMVENQGAPRAMPKCEPVAPNLAFDEMLP
jgi:hypothetical protein